MLNVFFSFSSFFRVKKEFEGVAAIPPNSNVVAAASATASTAASAVGSSATTATIPGSQYEPRLGTIQDAEGGQLPQTQQQADSEAPEKAADTDTASGATSGAASGPTPVATAAFAAAGVSTEPDSVHIPESKLQDVLQMAAKMDRKYSQAAMSQAEGEGGLNDLDEDYTPHFQRVYISGDDNTGVRFLCYDVLLIFNGEETL